MTNLKAMDPLLLIGSLIVLAAMLTWILPAGRFERTHDAATGRTMVVPGSFKNVPRNPVGPPRDGNARPSCRLHCLRAA